MFRKAQVMRWMVFMDWFTRRVVDQMTPQEQYDLASTAFGEMIASMALEERRDLIIILVPITLKTVLDGKTPEERIRHLTVYYPFLNFSISSSTS